MNWGLEMLTNAVIEGAVRMLYHVRQIGSEFQRTVNNVDQILVQRRLIVQTAIIMIFDRSTVPATWSQGILIASAKRVCGSGQLNPKEWTFFLSKETRATRLQESIREKICCR